MTGRGGEALDVALGLLRAPGLRTAARARPLPEGVGEVLAIAAGSAERTRGAAARTGYDAQELVEAARFYVQQVLLADGADAYRVLGAARGADPAVLRDHHRLLLRWLHPDRGEHEWDSALATRVNQAWNLLRDGRARARYDEALDALDASPAQAATAHRAPTLRAEAPPPPGRAAPIAVAVLGVACLALAWLAIRREDPPEPGLATRPARTAPPPPAAAEPPAPARADPLAALREVPAGPTAPARAVDPEPAIAADAASLEEVAAPPAPSPADWPPADATTPPGLPQTATALHADRAVPAAAIPATPPTPAPDPTSRATTPAPAPAPSSTAVATRSAATSLAPSPEPARATPPPAAVQDAGRADTGAGATPAPARPAPPPSAMIAAARSRTATPDPAPAPAPSPAPAQVAAAPQASAPRPGAAPPAASPTTRVLPPPAAAAAAPAALADRPADPTLDSDPLRLLREAEATVQALTRYLGAPDGAAPAWQDPPTGQVAAAIRRQLHARHGALQPSRLALESPNWTLGSRVASVLGGYRLDGAPGMLETGTLHIELARRDAQWRVASLRLEPAP